MLHSLGLALVALAPLAPVQTADYEQLTETRADVPNFMPDPFTGLARDSDGRLYAVNPYASLVNVYDDTSFQPVLIFPTGLNPVSVAVWEPDTEARHVLAVCQGTHALFVHAYPSGQVVDVLQLDSEPADIVLDETNERAFISCRGRNSVLQIDMSGYDTDGYTIEHRYELSWEYGFPALRTGERPGPLVFDEESGLVWVAQTVTGNNTTVRPGSGLSSIEIVDLDGATEQLQDHDIYVIDPSTQLVHPAVKGAGSLIFDIARATDPVTEAEMLYILSTDSLNADFDDEPSLRGQFVKNQLVMVDVTSYTAGVAIQAPVGIDLDDEGSSTYSHGYSIGQADSIEVFGDGNLLISGPTQDRVIEVDRTGSRVHSYPLNTQAQVYEIALLETAAGDPFDGFLALGLGNMQIEVFYKESYVSGHTSSLFSYDLGFDPTPDQLGRGRDIFLDGSRSLDGRVTCMSCHPQGNSDQLGWELSGVPFDHKELMVTQSLLSIADTFPHHWRGERDLADFGKAWDGLLGADGPVVEEDLDDVVAFMRSLQAPANPIQNGLRIVDDALLTPDVADVWSSTSAVMGQLAFRGVGSNVTENFNQQTCVECHPFPTGTGGDQFAEASASAPRAINIEAAHLRQLQHKGTEIAPNMLFSTIPLLFTNENGFGVTHGGVFATVFDFHRDGFGLDEQDERDIAEFVRQWDQGIAPAGHLVIQYPDADSAVTLATTEADIEDLLLDGAGRSASGKDWIDVIAFGRYREDEVTPSPWLDVRWLYDPDADEFVSDTTGIGPFSWAALHDEAEDDRLRIVVVGVPRGAGRIYGVDFDNDGLLNGDDPNPGTPNATTDTTAPQLLSYALDFTNQRVAKYQLEFSEPVTYEITYQIGTRPRTFERQYLVRQDSAVLDFHQHPNACDSFPCLDVDDTTVPPSSGEEPTPESSFTVIPTIVFKDAADNDGNGGTPLALTPGFTPAASFPMFTGDVFDDDTAEEPYKYVSFTRWIKKSMIGSTFDAEVQVEVRYDSGQPNPPGVADNSVVLVVGVAAPGAHEFNLIAPNTSEITQFFQTPTVVGTSLVAVPYPGVEGPLMVSQHTGAGGRTTLEFQIPNLVSGSRVRASVMAVAQDSGVSFPQPTYDETTLFLMKPLRLEDSMQTTVFEVP